MNCTDKGRGRREAAARLTYKLKSTSDGSDDTSTLLILVTL